MTDHDGDENDILIVGGGMVGMSLAVALARVGGFRCALVDALDPATATGADFDGRVSALADTSCRMLETLGVWQHLAAHAQPILDIVVSDGRVPGLSVREGASPFALHFDHRALGDRPLGNLVENRQIRVGQLAAIAQTTGVTHIAPATVRMVTRGPGGVRAVLDDGRTIKARLCVAADGRGSPLREEAGIKCVSWRYPQTGIVTTVEHERPHNGIAQEYFLPAGPFAILPMTGDRASLVWTESQDRARAILALDDAGFDGEMRRRFGDYLGEAHAVGPRWSYPLALHLARTYVAPRLVLVGDAAHGIHPIAGQGLNLGLKDVAALTEVLVDAKRLGLDIGSTPTLRRYETWRRFDNVTLAVVTDGLNRLFSNDIGPVRLVRDFGLGLVNRWAPAKNFFMRHAMGGVGTLPKLLAGERP